MMPNRDKTCSNCNKCDYCKMHGMVTTLSWPSCWHPRGTISIREEEPI